MCYTFYITITIIIVAIVVQHVRKRFEWENERESGREWEIVRANPVKKEKEREKWEKII